MQKESVFQRNLRKRLEEEFPGCMVLKNDANYIQGVPDLIVLYNNHWAIIECKKSESASHRPNQDYYVKKLDEMSYASFVYPENVEGVLDDLREAFRS